MVEACPVRTADIEVVLLRVREGEVIELRPYQVEILDKARATMRRGVRSLVIESPTGSGKTALTAMMVKTASSRGLRCWFLMHRVELLKQSMATFRNVEVPFGVVAAGFTGDPQESVQLCSIGSLKRRMDRLHAPNLIIYDEAHHVASKTWSDIRAAYPDAFHVGLTATPERLDGKGLSAHFSEIIHGPRVRWLIENKFLSDYRLVIPPGGVDATGVHRLAGDFNHAELAVVADQPMIVGNAVREYLKYARGKRAIARHVNILLSQRLAAEFIANGVPALHIDGKTPRAERDAAMESFVRGETLVLCNVDLFSEGVDVPSVECVLDLRPTESLTLCLQFWGRSLRPAPGKTRAIIIDMGGNYRRHGLPCEPREWNLDGRKKKTKKTATIINTECPKCYGVFIGSHSVCPDCGHDFTEGRGGGRVVEHVDGILEEVDVEAARLVKLEKISKWREIAKAKTLADFQALAVKFGYKSGWAFFRFRARQAKKVGKATVGEMFA